MAGVLIRMKLAILRNQMTGWRAWRMVGGGLLGLLAAFATIWLGAIDLGDPDASAALLALVLAGWTVGWFLGPVLLGGSDETLRPEYFRTIPVTARELATGLLASACVGVPAVVTVVALGALLPLGVRLGAVALFVAVLAVVGHLLLMLLLSRVTVGLLGAALRTRLGMDLVPLLISILLAVAIIGGLLLREPVAGYLDQLTARQAPDLPGWLLLLPSGWGVAAVAAVERQDWPVVVAGPAGLAALNAGLLGLWAVLLRRRMTSRSAAGRPRAGRNRATGIHPLVATPVGAATVRALRGWSRDTGMHIIVVATVGMGVIYAVVSGLAGWPFLLPFAALLALLVAANESANLFGFDGSALWHTLVVADSERPEVRGRQLAWLVVFVPITVAITVGCLAFTGAELDGVRSYVIALTPALLGAGSGLVVLFSVLAPYPVGMDGPVGGSGKSQADPVRYALVPLMGVAAVPPAATVALTGGAGPGGISWPGLLVGIGTGLLGGWLGGRAAADRLRERGPELLAKLAGP
ncbi:hypothetical protein O7627_16465 [Solwaraspora sp. WMMD1047]|uniref:hypothetical protein n=1 Tax=Solwaraspora sp. WMMD1047 TaxID=3016102 RepID=UPI002416E030|nr:hypothetical protein [Solwaraspora sp. WMMD1047]MDG4830891.1 hypothetical protein [Solwaraspora sp. WMMD1047]